MCYGASFAILLAVFYLFCFNLYCIKKNITTIEEKYKFMKTDVLFN